MCDFFWAKRIAAQSMSMGDSPISLFLIATGDNRLDLPRTQQKNTRTQLILDMPLQFCTWRQEQNTDKAPFSSWAQTMTLNPWTVPASRQIPRCSVCSSLKVKAQGGTGSAVEAHKSERQRASKNERSCCVLNPVLLYEVVGGKTSHRIWRIALLS